MAGLIKLTYGDLENASGVFRTKADEIENIITELSQKMAEVDGTWKGSTKDAFYEQFEECKQNLLQFPELLAGFAERLDFAANTMRDADDQLGSQIGGNN